MNIAKTLAPAFALLGLIGCRIPNEDHCGRRDGDETCRALDPERPFCSVCEAENDGCVASLANIPPDCRPDGAPIGGTETATSSGDSETTSAATGTETGVETDTGTDTEMGTDTETETGEPECGNGIKEDGEQCDGTDFGDATCDDPYGLPEGTLTCVPNQCVIDTSSCCLQMGELCQPGECCTGNCGGVTNKCGQL